MAKTFERMLYGGDYNPNQWPKETWAEDMQIFRDARINSATINVFSWAKLQPSEEVYDFSELDDIVDMLCSEGYDIVMGTSTAALPAWMVKRYPEVSRTDYEGRQHKFGQRHNACPNSPVFQKYAAALAGKLAARYGSNPHVTCWHISNEYCGECYCENCEKAFRVWLRKRYGSLDTLNRAWNTEFWGHTIYDWDEIVLPNALSEGIPGADEEHPNTCFAGISIDYRRFNSDSILANFVMEKEAIRAYDPNTPVTTNLMGTYKGLDYFRWAKEMDIVSWDNYPGYGTPVSFTAMSHDLMRGLKDAPFMLMEQAPSAVNWHPYNGLKRPGQMRAQSWQTVAHGADTLQFFQLRRSVGACEMYHSAVIPHAGTRDTRVFREVKALGEELERVGGQMIGTRNNAQTGLIFDWENYWAFEYIRGYSQDLRYVSTVHAYYDSFYRENIPVNLIHDDADFSGYRLILAPVLYMVKEGVGEALAEFVRNGGILVTTYLSGMVDASGNIHPGGYPGPLREAAGIWVEETDTLAPGQSNEVVFADGTRFACGQICDLMHLEGARSLAEYGQDFYAGTPAVTRHFYGSGAVYYIGTHLEQAGIDAVLKQAAQEANVASLVPESTPLEIAKREGEGYSLYFVINLQEEPCTVPESLAAFPDLLTGEPAGAAPEMKKFDVKVLLAV